MNILFVTDLCPITKEEWGLPSTLLNFILDFKALGHNVTLLRPNVLLNVLIRKRKILVEGEYEYKGVFFCFIVKNCKQKNKQGNY